LRDLVYNQAKINESIQKKLATNDKSLETIHAKMDGFSTTIKNQTSFNKMFETQLAQLATSTPAAESEKIPGKPESTIVSVNVMTTRWGKPSRKSSFTSYVEKLTRPRRGPLGELAVTILEDPGTPIISCSIFDCNFEQALSDLGASVNILPKVTFEKEK
jgi:seryl-tRNA synthetase